MSNAQKATMNSAKKTKNEPAEDVVVEYDGETYTVNPDCVSDDIEILEAFEKNKIVTGLEAIVGDAQWRKFKSKKRSMDDLGEFTKVIIGALGMDTGE